MAENDNSIAWNYLRTAREHLDTALQMWQDENYAARDYWVHYLSELAVECVLRAYLRRRTDQFDSRHDIRELAKEAKFYLLVRTEQQAKYNAYFSTLNLRWRSNHRYSTMREVRQHLFEVGAERKSKGDTFHNSSRTMLDMAINIVSLGESKWQTQR